MKTQVKNKSLLFLCSLMVATVLSCKKVNDLKPQVASPASFTITAEPQLIIDNMSTVSVHFSGDGNAVTSKGVCWAKDHSPTVADNKTTQGAGMKDFLAKLTHLTSGTTYRVKPYIACGKCITYGEEITFTTSSTRVLWYHYEN